MARAAGSRSSSKPVPRAREREWRGILEAISAPICHLDRRGVILHCNKAYAELVGRSVEEAVGQHCCTLLHGESHTPPECPLARVLTTRRHEEAELVHRGRWLRIAIDPVFGPRGKLSGAVHVLSDITEHKRGEQALRETELQLRALADTTSVGILLAQGEHLIYANAAAGRITGYGVDELQGMRFLDSVHGEFRELVRSRAAARLSGAPGVPSRYQIKITTKSGAERWVDLTSAAISLEGKPALVVTVADITEERRLRQLQSAIYEIGAATQSAGSLAELIRSIHTVIGRLMEASNLYIALYDPATDLVSFPYFVDEEEDEPPPPSPPGRGLTEYILRSGRPLLATPEVFDELLRRGEVVPVGAPSIDWLGVPLITGERTLGALVVQTYTEGVRYGERDMEILTFVSREVARAIERKRAEDALRESEERYRLLFRHAPIGVFHYDNNLRITACNDRFVTILQSSRERLIGLDMGSLHDQRVLPAIREALRGGNGEYEGTYRATTSAASPYVSMRTAPLRGDDGVAIGGVGIVEDITASRAAEEEHRRLTAAVEQAAETIVITDAEGTIQYVNPAFERVSGYGRDEAIGQKPSLLKSGRHDEATYRSLWQTIKRGETWQGHFINRRKDGSLFEEEATISPIKNAAGAIVSFVAVKRDVTQEVALEEQLRQAQKMEAVGRLAGGIAHDFNNVLQAVLALSQALPVHVDDPEKFSATAAELQEQVRRGASLTRQLLLFSRSEAPRLDHVELNELIHRLARMIRRLLRENISLSLDLAARPIPLRGDAGQLEQVLLNLAVNAADAMPGGGSIQIRTHAQGDEAALEVADEGCGMTEEVKARVFEPFFSTKDASKGTGLGLSVVHGIVTGHGGRIEVDSAVGRGSLFRVLLPIAAGSPVADEPATGEEHGPQLPMGGGERVLVVEDEPGAREGLVEILAMLGYDVVATGSRKETRALAAHPRFDLLLTDLMLPDGLGTELAEELKTRWPAMEVVLMSGYAQDEALRSRIASGSLRFLQKPFGMETLARELRAALDGRPASGSA